MFFNLLKGDVMKKIMIHDLRSNNLDRNLAKDPTNFTRCEMCWKPLYPEKNNVRQVFVTCKDNLFLPTADDVITDESPTFLIGPACYRDLRKLSKTHNFVVKAKKCTPQ